MTSIVGGIAGKLAFEGATVTQSEALALVSSAPHRALAGSEIINVGSGYLVTLYLHGDDRVPHPTVQTHDTRYSAVIHGAIHNTDEVFSLLGLNGTAAEVTAEELLVAAFLQWGERCPLYLIGDYAFAIWDADRAELFCARDAIGIKPFYYFYGDGVFLFGSEIDQVATLPEARSTLDYSTILDFSQDRSSSREATFFRDIRRLKGAHCMRVSPAGVRQFRYWNPVNLPSLELDSLDDYVTEFEKLLKEAIRVRMPETDGKLGVLLSGGVDSASVVAGIRQISGGAADGGKLLALSLGFAGLPCDESRTILANAQLLRVDVHLHQHKPFSGSDLREAIKQTLALPESVTTRAYAELFDYARKNHLNVVMGGWGADDWLGAWDGGYRDLLTGGQLRALSLLFKREVSCSGFLPAIRKFLSECIRDPMARQIKRLVSASGLPLFAGRANYVGEFDREGWKRVTKWNQYQWLNSPMFAINCEMQELSAVRRGIETRFPYNDRRIVEFGLRLPPRLFATSTFNKPVIRGFLARRVPEIDARMYSDPEGSPIYWQCLRHLYRAGDYELSLLSREFHLDPQWINSLIDPLKNPQYDAEKIPDLVRKQWNSYTCGVWLDNFSPIKRVTESL